MPNYLLQSLGQTGTMIERNNQDYVIKHLYIRDGACLSICVKFMTELKNLNFPTEKDYVEAAQWIQEKPGRDLRVLELANSAGLKRTETLEGHLDRDEISIAPFLSKNKARPTFNIFGFFNTQRNSGHALLFYQWAGEDWFLMDPNFGIAKWPNVNGLMVGLKRLLRTAYPDFGPYYRFIVNKYE